MMNEDMLVGEGRDIGGKVQETLGDITGDPSLQVAGLKKQVSGKVQKIVGVAKDTIDASAGPIADETRRILVRARPFAFVAIAGLIGAGLVSLFRRKR